MRTSDAVTILNGAADLAGLDRANLATTEFRILRDSLSNRLQTAWEFEMWPDITRIEKRYFRLIWSSATTYAAAAEVYYPGSGLYYQSLKGANTNHVPANSSDVTDLEWWAVCATAYSAADYDNAKAYVRGDQVFYPTTDRFYQLHTATSTGNLPSDTANWGVLTEFDRYVAYEQTGKTKMGLVVAVWDQNTKLTTKAGEVSWYLSENGIQVVSGETTVFPEFRIQNPVLNGENFVATTVYTADVSQIYYSSATLAGNFYNCVTTTSAGQDPDDTPAKWAKVEIPLMFERYLEHAMFADWLRHRGQSEKAIAQEQIAQAKLEQQSEVLSGVQGQRKRTVVMTR